MSINQKLVSLGLAIDSVNVNYEPVIVINYDKSICYLVEQIEQQQTTIAQLQSTITQQQSMFTKQQLQINELITNVQNLCDKTNTSYQ